MGKINYAKDANGNKYYPVTVGDAVAVNGTTLTKALPKVVSIKDDDFSDSDVLTALNTI